jgi:hypothetical protein
VSLKTQARTARSTKMFATYARRRLANYAKPTSSWEAYKNTPRDGLARLFSWIVDVIGNAVKVMHILKGEEPEITARRPRRTKPLLNRTALATRR